jgi:hypothetical protein
MILGKPCELNIFIKVLGKQLHTTVNDGRDANLVHISHFLEA